MTAHNPLRCSHSVMAQRGSNPVVLLNTGSYAGFAETLNQVWTFDGTDWTAVGGLINSAGPVPARTGFALAYDGYNIVMHGGLSYSETQSDTWTYNGSAWTKEAPATVPFGRSKHQLALFGTTGTAKGVMFGGQNANGLLNETWIWDGNAKTWTLAAPAARPPARTDFAFGGRTTMCVLFGGKRDNQQLGDTWSWDGTNWSQLTPTGSPSYRSEASMCWDPTNSEWVLFGGRNDFEMLPAQTYTLNSAGTAWTLEAPATSPPPRVGAQMCFSTQSNSVILFGGCDNLGQAFDDTWSWDGTTWTRL